MLNIIMYHTIEDLCKKIDVIKEKSDVLREQEAQATQPELIQFEIDDIQALCADIANDRGKS